jgi:peptide-methionine (S)-S-oxide reductase
VCAASTDGGQSFSAAVNVSPRSSFSVQGSNLAVGPQGELYVVWGDSAARGIRFARSTDMATSFTNPIAAANLPTYELLGPLLNSHFATNGLPSLAVDTSNSSAQRGTLYVVFSAPVANRPQDKSDVLIVRSTDQGQNWSLPQRVNDDATVNDQFMPAVAVDLNGQVGVMWYDRRNDTVHNGLVEVYGTASNDGGRSFAANRRISNASWAVLTTPLNIRANYHGDYNQLARLTDQPGFFFAWGDDRSGLDPDVYGAKVITNELLTVAEGLIVTTTTPAQTLLAGQRTTYRVQLLNVGDNDFADINLTAQSDTPIDSQFTPLQGAAGGNRAETTVTIRVPSNTLAGSHPLVLRAERRNNVATTTLRLNVLAPDGLGRIPRKVAATPGRSIQPSLGLSPDGSVNAVWVDDTQGNLRPFYAHSRDGATFTALRPVSTTVNTTVNPQVAVDQQDNVHVVWQECTAGGCGIMYSRSSDQGQNFSIPQLLSFGLAFSELPMISVAPQGEIDVFWDALPSLNIPQFEIFRARSVNNGQRFSPPELIASGGPRNLFTPAISRDPAGNSYLAYESCANGNCRIELRIADGRTAENFGAPTIASGNFQFNIRPVLATPGNGVIQLAMVTAIVTDDPRFEILATRSLDNGATFSLPINISQTPSASNNPTITARGQEVWVAWLDQSFSSPEILLSRSTDQGRSFAPPVNLSVNNTISQVPRLATDRAGNVQLLLEDEQDGNDEIYTFPLSGAASQTAITAVDPISGPPGTLVTVQGRNLDQILDLMINGQVIDFVVNNANELQFMVAADTPSGAIALRTPRETLTAGTSFNLSSALRVGPGTLQFGQIIAGQIVPTQQITLQNQSSNLLRISNLSVNNGDFRLVNTPAVPFQIAANNQIVLQVAYQPRVASSATATLQITSNDGRLPLIAVPLSGQASAPVLRLTAPQGGERLRAGNNFVITWDTINVVPQQFDLVLSTDGGASFPITIAQNLAPNDRQFVWTVPAIKSKTARVAVRMRTVDSALFQDQSTSNLRLKNPATVSLATLTHQLNEANSETAQALSVLANAQNQEHATLHNRRGGPTATTSYLSGDNSMIDPENHEVTNDLTADPTNKATTLPAQEVATLGGGCFWCLEAVYEELEGVKDVVSGYAGGSVTNPSYEAVSMELTGHAEVVQITFNPRIITYRDLLHVFFTIHDPTTLNRQGHDIGTQYRSAIFYHDARQQTIAKEVIREIEQAGIWQRKVVTEVSPLQKFYLAEAYHQDYFRLNPGEGYCQAVIAPKIIKFRQKFTARLKKKTVGR